MNQRAGRYSMAVPAVVLALFFSAGAPSHLTAAPPETRPGKTTAAPLNAKAVTGEIEAILREHPGPIRVTIWLGPERGKAWLERDTQTPMPSASAIKTFYLVELFDRYKHALAEPPPGVAEILDNDQHPAISHFSHEQRAEIRRELGRASVRRIGDVMMGKTNVSNAVYNAAANLTTALLGGPERLTTAIHERDSAFQGVAVRRYMLRDRKLPGDNEVTAAAFAALYQALAQGRLKGIDPPTMAAIREVLLRSESSVLGRNYNKGGSLNTDPVTLVHAGWWERPSGSIICVIMEAQPIKAPAGGGQIAANLAKTMKRLEQLLLAASIPQAGRNAASRPAAGE